MDGVTTAFCAIQNSLHVGKNSILCHGDITQIVRCIRGIEIFAGFFNKRLLTCIFRVTMCETKASYETCSIVNLSAHDPSHSAASRTWRFNVTGFSLPVAMAFSTDAAARAQVPQISPNSGSAQAFVKRLIIQGVLNVLEQQGRAAGLPDFVIATILGQLGINVLYIPLSCPKVSVNPTNPINRAMMMITICVIYGNTVTTTCLGMGAPGAPPGGGARDMCMLNMPMDFTPIPPQHLSISGTLSTSNFIMANWSREMWQNVVNRVLRMITSGSFGTHFATAVVTVT
ncbi:hypothetical protein KIN20_030984 [Parelaphostrongylus tenuis]|uniref:Uncharacterized protein n=1 Tax=Parelaphostrongylus tenuis TaxID=148309 RepID=A0AAD5R4X9_PARTN|nr:hypothetical protein KIN20_030984 [Parelaphostrongylus tenuis]